MPGWRELERILEEEMAYNDINYHSRPHFSRTRPNHGPTQLTKVQFIRLPIGSKIKMHHATGSGMVAIILAFEDDVYVSQWETEYGLQTYRNHYTDSGLDPYLLGSGEHQWYGWNQNNWVEIESLPAVHVTAELSPTVTRGVWVAGVDRELPPIRWQEAGF